MADRVQVVLITRDDLEGFVVLLGYNGDGPGDADEYFTDVETIGEALTQAKAVCDAHGLKYFSVDVEQL